MILEDLPSFLATYGALLAAASSSVTVLVGVATIIFETTRLRQETRQQRSDERKEWFTFLQEQRRAQLGEAQLAREQYYLAIEERRLGEANVVVDASLDLAYQSANDPQAHPFLIFRLPLHNEGDGPVDILASLVSSRVLSNAFKAGVGLRGRDVEWSDYGTYYWNERGADSPFAGISTTKNMLARPNHFIRLAVREHGGLRRIDAVNDVAAYSSGAPFHLMYRVFLVIRGYPLGEILAQVGGSPPDPLQNYDVGQVQTQSLAQPNYTRWRKVQEALLNLNRLAFRVAIGEDDPLGTLTEQDAWRFFLLYHEDFANADVEQRIAAATAEITGAFGSLELPPGFQHEPRFEQVQESCATMLEPMVRSWRTLQTIIQECHQFDLNPSAGRYAHLPDADKVPHDCPAEGYPVRIHQDMECRRRWMQLRDEGYLVSRHSNGKGATQAAGIPVPVDPRLYEPFVMRIHYFLQTVGTLAAANGEAWSSASRHPMHG